MDDPFFRPWDFLPKKMKILIIICRCYVILIAAAGFLFGHTFFGGFDWPATMGGFCGIFSGIFSSTEYKNEKNIKTLLALFCVGGLFGVFWDAKGYYSTDHVPGNDYAWELLAPFCIALVIILLNTVSANQSPQHTDDKENIV